ncbi:cell surface composition regulator GlgS [Cronobacter turicensis]|uniref:cell surface composition regulator GlgS n=1 Tax=Cronobacter turicensis TaxID=413502 RepID=UPI0024AF5F35|nr:cell surface composition regulator GlgS [Cronobacter turicensis]MDI7404357.1 cell surface composition regulator GlgS [Cronobacter turicensis]
MNRQDIYSFKNFDFLASSFARMNVAGRRIDIDAVTGNMSEAQSAWFRERYNHYRKHGLQLTLSAAHGETELCA